MVKVIKGLPVEWERCSRTVILNDSVWDLAYWKDTIAVGVDSDIIIFDAITGCQDAILSEHIYPVTSVTFLSGGVSLISGSETVKLWDIQTGGVVKTFHGHTGSVYSVSASMDCTTIASGSDDRTIRLWDIQTGECHHVIEQQEWVHWVCFSPVDPQYLISGSDNNIWKWNIDNYQMDPMHEGVYAAFSSDGTQLVSCQNAAIVVQKSDSREIMAKCDMPNSLPSYCCFSPDNRLVAVAADETIYVWDITGSDPHIVETFVGHTDIIYSLKFSSPSSLISLSQDKSIKFWQIGAPSMDLTIASPKSAPLTPAPVESVTIQAKSNIAVSRHVDGVIRTWDLSTGLCKTFFQTPAGRYEKSDVQLIDGKLILVWLKEEISIWIWDVEKEELIRTVDVPRSCVEDFKISEDGSKVFCLYKESIQAFSIWTGEVVDRVEKEWGLDVTILAVDGPRVWIQHPGLLPQGWDFGIPGSPIELSDTPLFNDTKTWNNHLHRIEDAVTGGVVHQLYGRFAGPKCSQWDGQYLVAGYESGEILILDFNHTLPQ